jgi:hypothetical protein
MGSGVSIHGSATTTGATPVIGGPLATRCIGRKKNPAAPRLARMSDVSRSKVPARLCFLARGKGPFQTTRLLLLVILPSNLEAQ